ncbi:hypothetical protein EJ02DRAFT_461601 [Clathrospora elynae]|uniref:Uncharacterized protein n=1 Tax=Clathrospora elynae TaxID=706981 RepID=A0A6A5T486_9PLEO|nr:hypothetical protein EJ02DRAFT_461601 [Clathrospora elynae]
MTSAKLAHAEHLTHRLRRLVFDRKAYMRLVHVPNQALHGVSHRRSCLTLLRRAQLKPMRKTLPVGRKLRQSEHNLLGLFIGVLLINLVRLLDVLELRRLGRGALLVLVPRLRQHDIGIVLHATKVLLRHEIVPELQLWAHKLGCDLAHAPALREQLLELGVGDGLDAVLAGDHVAVVHLEVFTKGAQILALKGHHQAHVGDETVGTDEGGAALGNLAVGAAELGVVRNLDAVTTGEIMVAASRVASKLRIGEVLVVVLVRHRSLWIDG